MLPVTWENVREHAAGAFGYWGSRGRRFKSGRPDSERVSAGQRLAGALLLALWLDLMSSKPLLEPFTRRSSELISGEASPEWPGTRGASASSRSSLESLTEERFGQNERLSGSRCHVRNQWWSFTSGRWTGGQLATILASPSRPSSACRLPRAWGPGGRQRSECPCGRGYLAPGQSRPCMSHVE
jgi:hypothetical protein